MTQSLATETNKEIGLLVDAWCERRAIGPLRAILACYPLANNLTDDWAALASGLKTIRVRHGRDLEPGEMEKVVEIQQLAERIMYR